VLLVDNGILNTCKLRLRSTAASLYRIYLDCTKYNVLLAWLARLSMATELGVARREDTYQDDVPGL